MSLDLIQRFQSRVSSFEIFGLTFRGKKNTSELRVKLEWI